MQRQTKLGPSALDHTLRTLDRLLVAVGSIIIVVLLAVFATSVGWLNGGPWVGNVTALAALALAFLSLFSQRASLKAQAEANQTTADAKAIQEATHHTAQKTLEIQLNMDRRDLRYRQGRARVSLGEFKRRHAASHVTTSGKPTNEMVQRLTDGWQDLAADLPECALRDRITNLFPRLVSESEEEPFILPMTREDLRQLFQGNAEQECLDAIRDMQ